VFNSDLNEAYRTGKARLLNQNAIDMPIEATTPAKSSVLFTSNRGANPASANAKKAPPKRPAKMAKAC